MCTGGFSRMTAHRPARRRSAGEDTGVVDVDPERLFTADAGACAEARALLTPQLLAALKSFEKNLGGTVAGLAWDASTLLLAVDTAYVFADVPDIPDARKPEALRRQYAASLAGMQHALDALFDSSGLFCPE